MHALQWILTPPAPLVVAADSGLERSYCIFLQGWIQPVEVIICLTLFNVLEPLLLYHMIYDPIYTICIDWMDHIYRISIWGDLVSALLRPPGCSRSNFAVLGFFAGIHRMPGINHYKPTPIFWGVWVYPISLWLFNIAMENGPFIDGLPINYDWKWWFSMAMLVITRW
jgi:hypothetical protein